MDSHDLSPFRSDLKAYVLEATGTWYVNHEFLIADVIQFVSGTMTTFSQGDGTKIKSNMIQSGDICKLSAMDLESYFTSTVTLFSHIVQMMVEEGYTVTVYRSGWIRRAVTYTNK